MNTLLDPTRGPIATELPHNEESPRYQAIWKEAREGQFDSPALHRFTDEELVYLAGHRYWEEVRSDHLDAGNTQAIDRRMQAYQHRARGNALRAKDELDRRTASRQLKALEASNTAVAASNEHVAATAKATRDLANSTKWMAGATIAAAIATSVVAIVTIVRDDEPPSVTVAVPTDSGLGPESSP